MIAKKMKKKICIAIDAAPWHRSNLQLVCSAWLNRDKNKRAGFSDEDHLRAAAQWLARAQDASTDGGIAGRYSLASGWSSSYPETTGYIIPTLLHLAHRLNEAEYHERAKRCVDFLLAIQLENGAFPGLEIAVNRTEASLFNSAQIVHGLRAWHAESGDQATLQALTRACDWLVEQQDEDGAWRKFTYGDLTYTYMAHAACWLAETGAYLQQQTYLKVARRHLHWVLEHVDEKTGWIDKCGFSHEDHQARRGVTHTIAYTVWGVLLLSKILGHEQGLQVARTAACQIAKRLELSHWLPGVLDWQWRPQANYACLTGNAQMALIWFELNRLDPEPALINAALKAIDLIKQAQPLLIKNPGIRGGIPGSDPVWGDYIYAKIPNWAAKFFIDALLDKQETMAHLSIPPAAAPVLPNALPSVLPSMETPQTLKPIRTILYTLSLSDRAQQLIKAWSDWGFSPAAVVVSHRPEASLKARVLRRIRQKGLHGILQDRIRRKTQYNPSADDGGPKEITRFCQQHGIAVVHVGALDAAQTITAIQALQPDIAINAGTGILRKALLAVPRLGTLNAHMGVLPVYRGMNVAEWARLIGDVVGCSVHLIDEGIDTGNILCCQALAVEKANSIAALRALVDQAQIRLLGEVLHYIYATGKLPLQRAQQLAEGRQFFVMHPELRAKLEAALRVDTDASL